ncbi:MAG: 3-oxoacyl-ACP synthase, partial [Gemmatimonas sp.]
MKRPIAYFAGTGRGVPATVMTNFDFAKIGIETTDEWIVERTGIKERHIATTESTTDLAAAAARTAMEKAGVHAGELDIIVLATASPDRLLPSAAVDLQAALGASRAAAFDVGAACSGFIYGSTIAEAMMAAGNAETALVVGVEKLSAITDWTDRSTCVLFGDGAGAAVLKRSRQHRGILSTFL